MINQFIHCLLIFFKLQSLHWSDFSTSLIHSQDSFFESGNLTTYIGTVSSKPGTEFTGTSFKNWQKGGGVSQ